MSEDRVSVEGARACADEGEAIAARATRGPIDVHRFDNEGGSISWQLQQAPLGKRVGTVLCEFSDRDNRRARLDALFYADARTRFPAFVGHVRALADEVERLQTGIKELVDVGERATIQRDKAEAERDALRAEVARLRGGAK